MEQFFDYTKTHSSADNYDGLLLSGFGAPHVPSGLQKQDSYETVESSGSRSSSLSLSDASSSYDSPPPERIGFHNGQLQLRWSAETQELVPDDSSNMDQHHEKSCPRCKLTPAEARKCKLERRRGQNRESQRKYRARKESRLREAANQVAVLETYVEFLEKHNNELEEFNAKLQQQIKSFDSEEPVCTIHGDISTAEEARAKDPEAWGAMRPSTTVVSTSAEELNAGWVPDGMHLSLFYHELLPPQHQLNLIESSEDLDYSASI